MPHNPEGKVTIWFLHRGEEVGGRVIVVGSSKIQMGVGYHSGGGGAMTPQFTALPELHRKF